MHLQPVHLRDGLDSADDLDQRIGNLGPARGALLQQPGHALQVVLDPVMDFADQHVALFDRVLEAGLLEAQRLGDVLGHREQPVGARAGRPLRGAASVGSGRHAVRRRGPPEDTQPHGAHALPGRLQPDHRLVRMAGRLGVEHRGQLAAMLGQHMVEERERPRDQVGHRRTPDRLEAAVHVIHRRQARLCDEDRVVDQLGELAEALLGLDQLVAQRALAGDIVHDGQAHRPAVEILELAVDAVDPSCRAVVAYPHAALPRTAPARLEARLADRVGQADQPVARAPDDVLERAVDQRDASARVGDHQADRRLLEEALEALPVGAEPLLHADLLGLVVQRDQLDARAVRGVCRVAHQPADAHGPVALNDPAGHHHRHVLAAQCALALLEDHLPVLGHHPFGRVAPDQVLGPVAEHLAVRPVDLEHAEVRILDRLRRGRLLEQQPEHLVVADDVVDAQSVGGQVLGQRADPEAAAQVGGDARTHA